MLTDTDELLIVGSGPSLANQVTSRIPLRSALLLNGAIHLLGAAHERPFAVIVEDERFIWRHRETLVEKIPAGTDCYFSTSVIRALCETIPTWLADQRVRHLNFLHRPYGIKRPDRPALKSLPFQRWSDDNTVAVSLAPQFGFMPAGSVAVTAAQLALFLAPARIGFAGVDLNETHRPRFYEKPDDMAMSRLDAAIDNILASLHLIADECSRRGIVIENYSPNSMLKNIGIRYVSRLSE